nr:hypothetical protein [Tanacetum cinerariifolium]
RVLRIFLENLPEHPSDTKVFTMKMEILIEPTSNKLLVDNATETVKEDYPDLVCADGSLEVMQSGLDMIMQELYDHIVEIQSAVMLEMISTLERDNMRLRGITMPTATHFGMAQAAINKMIAKCVAEALEAYGATRNPVTKTKMENKQQDYNVEDNVNNGNSNGNGNGNPHVNNEGVVPVTREFTYQDFLKCQPLNFKGTKGVVGFTRWFKKIETMVPNEEDRVEKYIGGLPANIQGNVIAAELTRLHDAIHIANNLMDQKFKGYAENKRRKAYVGTLHYYNKFSMHHEGPCTVKCGNCKRVGHMTRDCKVAVVATALRSSIRNLTSVTCYECGRQGHYRSECPKLRKQNSGNKKGNNEAKAISYAIGGGGASPDSNVVTGTFLLNNRYASMLFDSGIDKSFVLTRIGFLAQLMYKKQCKQFAHDMGLFALTGCARLSILMYSVTEAVVL